MSPPPPNRPGPRLVRPPIDPNEQVYPVRLPPQGTQGLGQMGGAQRRRAAMQARPMPTGHIVAGPSGVAYCAACSRAQSHTVQGTDGLLHNGACPVLQQIGGRVPTTPTTQSVGAAAPGGPFDAPPNPWPYGGTSLPPEPLHNTENPITTYHREQGDDSQENPSGGSNSAPAGGGGSANHPSGSTRTSAAEAAGDKAIEKSLTTLLQLEQSQLKPLGRLGGTFTLVAQINPADPGGSGLYIPDIEIARLEGKKAGTRVTLYSKNGPFLGESSVNPGSAVGPEDFAAFGNGFQPRVLLKIRVGGGNAAGGDNILQVVPAGVPVTLSGESIYVTAGVYLDELGLSPFFMDGSPGSFSTTVSAFLSVQGDHTDQKSTQWVQPVTPLSNQGVISTDEGSAVYGPRHLKQAHGFASAANAATTYLMFFDWNGVPTALPPNGTIPLFTIPVPPGDHFSWDCISSSRKFEWGLVWALSTAPDFFELDGLSLARVDLELYSDLQTNP
jgi:hypothetical protein